MKLRYSLVSFASCMVGTRVMTFDSVMERHSIVIVCISNIERLLLAKRSQLLGNRRKYSAPVQYCVLLLVDHARRFDNKYEKKTND